jgi:hypothetical protein
MFSMENLLRFFVGGFFLFHGINGFLNFYAIPEPEQKMKKFLQALIDARFIMPTVKMVETLSGLMLLFSLAPALAMILLLPIVFGVVASQLFLNGKRGYFISALTAVPYVTLLIFYWPIYSRLF